MNRFLGAVLVVIAGACWFPAVLGDDYPFASIANLPERKLIGADKHGYPRIEGKDKGEVARIATSPQSPPELRSLATWGLAISGYSPESADGLIKVVTDGALGNRDTAAMGLRNFTVDLPANKKEEFRASLRGIVESEGLGAPKEMIRVLLAWGDAPWIAEQFERDLVGHTLEIEIIKELPAAAATPRLLEIYRRAGRDNDSDCYNQRASVGRALADFRHKRGIDILDTLLDAASVPTHEGAPSHQHRANVFAFIRKSVGNTFNYEHRNYDPSIDEAILRFREWWLEKRYQFAFPKE